MKVITREYPTDWDYASIYPISDVHLGAKGCREREFKRYIKQIQEDDRAIVILAGDLINNGIKSSVTNVFEETMTPHEQKYEMVDILRPISQKIACICNGNHERRNKKETSVDITQDMAYMLGIEDYYGRDMAITKLSLGKAGMNSKRVTYSFLVTHGAGGGMYIGSGLNRTENLQFAIEGIDGIIQGHTHKPTKTPSGRLVFDPRNNKVTESMTLMFVCTGWIEYEGYPMQKGMRPVAFMPDTITLSGKRKEWS